MQRDEGEAALGLEPEVTVAPCGPVVDKLGEGGVGEAVVGRPEVHGAGGSRGVGSHFIKSELKVAAVSVAE